MNLDLNLKINSENVLSPTKATAYSNKNKSSILSSSASHLSSEHSVNTSRNNELSFARENFFQATSNGQQSLFIEKHTQQQHQQHQQTLKAFCKHCINELTMFQIGFDEAIQLCTNINVNYLALICWMRKILIFTITGIIAKKEKRHSFICKEKFLYFKDFFVFELILDFFETKYLSIILVEIDKKNC